MRGRGWEGLGRKIGGRGEKEGQDQVWEEMRRCTEIEQRFVAIGELRIATRKSQIPGNEEAPRT